MASSNVFEHSRPMLNTIGLRDLADLAGPHHRRHRGLAAHADQGQLREARLLGLVEGQRVGRVGVAAAGARPGSRRGWRRRRGSAFHEVGVALQVGHERGPVDVVVLHRPEQDRRHQAAVLAHLVDHVVRRPGQHDVGVDAGHLVVGAGRGRRGARRPGRSHRPEPGAGPGAAGAALLAVDAVVGAELVLEVERLVAALGVVVADDVVGARDHATRAAGAQAGVDDLVVQLLPLVGPAGWTAVASSCSASDMAVNLTRPPSGARPPAATPC